MEHLTRSSKTEVITKLHTFNPALYIVCVEITLNFIITVKAKQLTGMVVYIEHVCFAV